MSKQALSVAIIGAQLERLLERPDSFLQLTQLNQYERAYVVGLVPDGVEADGVVRSGQCFRKLGELRTCEMTHK